jgi:hypothetical protein
VVKAGDVVKVKVLEVDVARKRIALTMRLVPKLAEETFPPSPSRGGLGWGWDGYPQGWNRLSTPPFSTPSPSQSSPLKGEGVSVT